MSERSENRSGQRPEITHSRVYQPERYCFSSKDDQITLNNNVAQGCYDSFKIQLQIPVLNVKSVELLRASIPCITPSIPDTELTFWYYRLPVQSGYEEPVPPAAQYLQCVRIQPSYTPVDLVQSNYPINRVYSTYSDLLGDLNLACSNDLNNPYFIANDISFSLNAQNKFVFTGNNVYGGSLQYFYSYAGYADPNVEAAKIVLRNATQDNFGIYGLAGQPFTIGRDLNLRLGFTWSGNTLTQNDYRNHIRPVPNYFLGGSLIFNTSNYTAESYGDLVYSANVCVYCNLIGGSAYDSAGRPDLLSIIPLNTASLGVAFYNNVISTPLTKVPREIYEVELLLRSDTGDSYILPDSAITNIELKFSY